MAGPLIQPDENVDASLFINEAAANPDPTLDEGRVPILESTGQLAGRFLPTLGSFLIRDIFDGTTIPKAVYFNKGLIPSNAESVGRAKFLGFTKGVNATFNKPSYINHQYRDANSGASFAVTAYAGTNRVLILSVLCNTGAPSGITWAGNAMTLLRTQGTLSVWYRVIGDSGVDQSNTLVVTGGTWTSNGALVATTYGGFNQTTPFVPSSDIGSSGNVSVDVIEGVNTLLVFSGSLSAAPTIDAAFTNNFTQSGVSGFGAYRWNSGERKEYTRGINKTYVNSGGGLNLVVVEANGLDQSTEVKVQHSGIVTGFTGLSKGLPYYLQTTSGDIGTVRQGAGVMVGVALSSTELLIRPDVETETHGTYIFQNSVTAISTGEVVIAFQAELYDTINGHDNVTNNSRITVPCAGVYTITAGSKFTTAFNGAFGIRKNGSLIVANSNSATNTNWYPGGSVSAVIPLEVNDYIELVIRADRAGNTSGNTETFMSLALMR